jgi:hypothetical protein
MSCNRKERERERERNTQRLEVDANGTDVTSAELDVQG